MKVSSNSSFFSFPSKVYHFPLQNWAVHKRRKLPFHRITVRSLGEAISQETA